MAKGRKTGGRTKGTPNRSTVDKQALIARAVGSRDGVEPLDVMLTAMRDAWNKGDVLAAVAVAEKCAPYRHPKLGSVELSGNPERPLAFEVISGVMRGSDIVTDDDGDRPQTTH